MYVCWWCRSFIIKGQPLPPFAPPVRRQGERNPPLPSLQTYVTLALTQKNWKPPYRLDGRLLFFICLSVSSNQFFIVLYPTHHQKKKNCFKKELYSIWNALKYWLNELYELKKKTLNSKTWKKKSLIKQILQTNDLIPFHRSK